MTQIIRFSWLLSSWRRRYYHSATGCITVFVPEQGGIDAVRERKRSYGLTHLMTHQSDALETKCASNDTILSYIPLSLSTRVSEYIASWPKRSSSSSRINPFQPWLLWFSGLSVACELKAHQFDSRSGHMPGVWARSPVGSLQEAANRCFSPSVSPSHPLSLNINK